MGHRVLGAGQLRGLSPHKARYKRLYNRLAITGVTATGRAGWIQRLREVGTSVGCRQAIEFGCGTGADAEALVGSTGWDFIGVDIANVALAVMPDRLQRICADVTTMDPVVLGVNRYDLAYCAFLVHLLTASEKANFYWLVSQVLRPGGIFMCLTASEEDLRNRRITRYFPSAYTFDIERYLPIETNVAMLVNAGFRSVEVEVVKLGEVSAKQELQFYESRASSILNLLPRGEVDSGLARLRSALEGSGPDEGVGERKREWRRTAMIAKK